MNLLERENKEETNLLSVLLFGERLGYEFLEDEKGIIPKLQKKYHSGPGIADIEFSAQERKLIQELKIKYKYLLEKYKNNQKTMENSIVQQEQKNRVKPWWVNIVMLAGPLVVLIQTFLLGSGDVGDFISQALGALVMTAIMAFIVGLIPHFFLRQRINRPKLVIFSITFLLISVISLMGNLYRG